MAKATMMPMPPRLGMAMPFQQLGQLGNIGGYAPSPSEQVSRGTVPGLILEIDILERLAVLIFDDEAGIELPGGPGLWESAALGHR